MRELLSLVRCELYKLKRKHLVPALVGLGLLLPLLLALYEWPTQQGMASVTAAYKAGRLDYFTVCLCAYGCMLLMPCLLGVLAVHLFFLERDNDTFKNLRVIPVTSAQLIFAKLSTLLLLELAFVATLYGGLVFFFTVLDIGSPAHAGRYLAFTLCNGLLAFANSLPVVVLVVYCNRSNLISLLLCFFYDIFSWGAALVGMLAAYTHPQLYQLLRLHAPLCALQWATWQFADPAQRASLESTSPFLPSGLHTVGLHLLVAGLSLGLILRFYKKWAG